LISYDTTCFLIARVSDGALVVAGGGAVHTNIVPCSPICVLLLAEADESYFGIQKGKIRWNGNYQIFYRYDNDDKKQISSLLNLFIDTMKTFQ